MFSKATRQNYRTANAPGTNMLRTAVRSKIFSGDSATEDRLVNYQLYWQFYVGKHWAENNDKLLSFNYCKAVIEKVNNFMTGKDGFSINVLDTWGNSVDAATEKSVETMVNYVWKKNKKKLALAKLLQMGSICGDAYIFLSPDIQKGYIKIDILDSRNTIPLFKDGDTSNIYGWRVAKPLGENKKEYVAKMIEYTLNASKVYYVKEISDQAVKFEMEESTNNLGFIPIVHIQNLANSGSFGGFSDMADILKLNKIYNEMSEDMKMIVDYYAAPTTVITGATVGQLKRGVDQIWSGLPAEASVQTLSLGEDLSGAQGFLKILKDAIHDLSGVPEEILSKVQHISNTSAAALQMLYQSLIQAADKKGMTYGEGLTEVNRMIGIMMVKFFAGNSLPMVSSLPKLAIEQPEGFFDRYWIEPKFTYNLPNDRLVQLNEAEIELRLKLGSRQEVMERMGKTDIPKLTSEMEADGKFMKQFEPVVPEPGGGGGIPSPPAPSG